MQRGHDRQRQDTAERRRNRERQDRADDEPDRGADRGEQHHLGQVDREDAAAGRAQRFQRRDRVAAAVEIVLHGVGDADAADEQRGEANQREVLREALDVAAERGRRVGARAHLPAGVGQLLLGCRDDCIRDAVIGIRRGKPQAVVPAHQAAGLDQAGRAQRRLADEQARAEADAAGELVGFAFQDCAKLDRGGADRHPRAALQIEPREQRRIDGRAECAVALGQRAGERACRVERDIAIERIGAVHRLELDQRGLPIGGARHRPHRGGDRDAAVVIEEFALGRACLARHQRERRIAAENDRGLRAPARLRGCARTSRRPQWRRRRARCRK